MRVCLTALIWVVASMSAHAEEQFASRITSVATGDINGDKINDAAMLMAPADDAGSDDHALVVSFGDDFEDTVTLQVYVPDFVWGGTGVMVGNRASVTINERGSVLVKSHNEAIGRDRWMQTITLAWRDDDLLVAGYTYDFYDTLDNEHTGGCDLNLLTGKGSKTVGETTEPYASDLIRVPVIEWKARAGDDPCGFWKE